MLLLAAASWFFQNKYTVNTYNNALQLIDNDSYKTAKTELEKIVEFDYKDTDDLIKLCEAHISYDDGCCGVYWDIENLEFKYQTKERLALYSEKNEMKQPILADSFLVTNDSKIPAGYENGIHMFGSYTAFNLNSALYCWNGGAPEIYVYFKTDAAALRSELLRPYSSWRSSEGKRKSPPKRDRSGRTAPCT